MYLNGDFIENLHTGSLIETWIRDHHITKTKFAELMDLPQTNAGRLLKNKSMDIGKLIKVCQVLKHNFFADICEKPQYADNIEIEPVNIGRAIENRLKIQGITQTEFAKKMGMHQPDVSRLLKKDSIDTEKLIRISQILNFNFFGLYLPLDDSNPVTIENLYEDFKELLAANIASLDGKDNEEAKAFFKQMIDMTFKATIDKYKMELKRSEYQKKLAGWQIFDKLNSDNEEKK